MNPAAPAGDALERARRPIVQRVDLFTFLLLVVVAGLAAALVVARRRPEQPSESAEAAAGSVPDDTSPLAVSAQLAPVGIVIVDSAGERIFENGAARLYAAATADEAVVALRLRNLIKRAALGDEPVDQEIELYSPEQRTIQLRAVPLFGSTDRLGTACFIQDLTTTSQVESMRSDFIANASHELKTPLGAMRLLAEALVATDDVAVRNELANKIQSEAVRINHLVEDILDLAIVESAPLESTPVDLDDVVADALTQTRTSSEALRISVECSSESLVVSGDHRTLVSVIANLVENALSYTAAKGSSEPQPIEVRVRSEGDLAVIEVEDHGIGIPERHQNRIFERFYRVDRGRSRERGGTGLGLAIVRHGVESHRGNISVQSIPGEGSTFRIELPAREV